MNNADIAVVFIDPQNEVLSDKGLAWEFVGDSVRENRTVDSESNSPTDSFYAVDHECVGWHPTVLTRRVL
jgi:hypothetical protein